MQKKQMQKEDKKIDHFALIEEQIKLLQLGKEMQTDQLKRIGSVLQLSFLSLQTKIRDLRKGKQNKKLQVEKQKGIIKNLKEQNKQTEFKNSELHGALKEKQLHIRRREDDFNKIKERFDEVRCKLKEEIWEMQAEIYEKDEEIKKLKFLNKINVSYASSKQFKENVSNIQDSQEEDNTSSAGMQVYMSQMGDDEPLTLSGISQIQMKQLSQDENNCNNVIKNQLAQ